MIKMEAGSSIVAAAEFLITIRKWEGSHTEELESHSGGEDPQDKRRDRQSGWILS